MKILEFHYKRFKENLIVQVEGLNQVIERIKRTPEFTRVEKISISKNVNPNIQEKASILNLRMNMLILNSRTDISVFFKPFEYIASYREQVLAPLYTMVYSIFIFFLDEIGRFYCVQDKWFYFFVAFLTLISFLYWLTLWLTFLLHSLNLNKREFKEGWWQKMDKKIGQIPMSCIKLTIASMVAYIGLWSISLLNIVDWRELFWSLFLCLIPIFIIGLIRIYKCTVIGYYSYTHILGHLIAICLYSIIITIVIVQYFPLVIDSCSKLFNLKDLRFFIILFALLNGFLAPYIFPFISGQILYWINKRLIEKEKKKVFSKFEELKMNCKKLYESITDDVI